MKIGIVGATGYTGIELIRILLSHSEADISIITSETNAGVKISELYPNLLGIFDKKLVSFNVQEFKREKIELAFLCVPHGKSMSIVPELNSLGIKVIDLGADYRFKDYKIYEKWYKLNHLSPELLSKSVYGLPKIFRNKIKKAKIVGNPGCYTTASILSLYQMVNEGLVDKEFIVIDALSGVSGAGKKITPETNFLNVNEDVSAYKVVEHRHTPEITSLLKAKINFTPHLVPLNRGILVTAYAYLKKKMNNKNILQVYKNYYGTEKFIKILEQDMYPKLSDVKGTNNCIIGFKLKEDTKSIIVVAAIDNLVKGASGQAVQNMNVMSNFKEEEGLINKGIIP